MTFNPWVTFGAGLLSGIIGPRFLLGQPQGRQAVKTLIRGGFAVYDWAIAQVETLREDVADLAAEARLEQERSDPAPAARREGAKADSGEGVGGPTATA